MARVASGVGGNNSDVAGPVRQWLRRGDGPIAIRVGGNNYGFTGGEFHRDICARLSVTIDGRPGVISDVVTLDSSVRVRVQPDFRRFRSNGVDDDRNDDFGLVARWVLRDNLDVVIALGERLSGRRSNPGTVVLYVNRNGFACRVNNDDAVAGFAGTMDGWFIAGRVSLAIVLDGTAYLGSGSGRRNRVYGKVDDVDRSTGFFPFAFLDDINAVVAVVEVNIGGKCPGLVRPDRGAADFLAIVIDVDDCARLTLAGNDRTRIVGGVAIGDHTLLRPHMVGDLGISDGGAGLGVMFVIILGRCGHTTHRSCARQKRP